MMYLFLIVGFVLLIEGADFFVEGSSSVAKRLKVPSVVIGLTIVAIGTSAPEAAVSITAGLAGNNDIALSNVIGSNIFNLMVVIGVSALLAPFAADTEILKRDMPVNLAAAIIVFVAVFIDNKIGRLEGACLLVGIAAYIYVLVRDALKDRKNSENGEEVEILPIWKTLLYILVGIVAIVMGGDLVVDSASAIARAFGMSDTLVGLTIVAIGTSLPELVTSVVACGKGESGLALGNAVGSSIFNLLFILGISSVLSPIGATTEGVIDMVILIGVSTLIIPLSMIGKKVSRFDGVLCILVYVVYMGYAIARNYM